MAIAFHPAPPSSNTSVACARLLSSTHSGPAADETQNKMDFRKASRTIRSHSRREMERRRERERKSEKTLAATARAREREREREREEEEEEEEEKEEEEVERTARFCALSNFFLSRVCSLLVSPLSVSIFFFFAFLLVVVVGDNKYVLL